VSEWVVMEMEVEVDISKVEDLKGDEHHIAWRWIGWI
jgi:hypothetical protein